MTNEIDDIRLTTYALGELEGDDAKEIEALVATDAKAAKEVADIRAFAAALANDLAKERGGAALTADQKAKLRSAATASPMHLYDRPNSETPRPWFRRPGPIAAAACVLLIIGAMSLSSGGGGGPMMRRLEMASGHAQVPYLELPTSGEAYAFIEENPFVRAIGDDARSTFALDVDTASYSNVRRLLRQNVKPDKGAVRIEELINYFDYEYPRPVDGKPLAVSVEIGSCPWAPAHRLALVGVQAKTVDQADRGRANLVFLIDVSGSMNQPGKLPLVKQSLRLLIDQLRADDRIALVVYAGSTGMVLPSTAVSEKAHVHDAIERLSAGGSTNGGAGIELAYTIARANFVKGGVNRVLLCTDGDFNVGVTSESSLVDLVRDRAKAGVFLTVLGFGMGDLQDGTLEKLANEGNGVYGYIDTLAEAKKLFVEQAGGTLVTVAKDARIQVEFNPAAVGAWRLIGYENRLMANRDFNDDTKDAGEVGSGHSVTALYEIIPAGSAELDRLPKDQPLRYQAPSAPGSAAGEVDLFTVALRYEEPDGDVSALVEVAAKDARGGHDPSKNLAWASVVAMFGMQLRESPHKGLTNWALIDELARSTKGADRTGARAELIELIGLARAITR